LPAAKASTIRLTTSGVIFVGRAISGPRKSHASTKDQPRSFTIPS
jgi:hypothetical protein